MPSLDFDLVIQCSSDLVRAAAFARTYRSRLLLLRSICDHLCPPNNSDISDHSKRDVGFPDKFASYRNSYPVSGFIRGLFVAATHDYLALNRMRWSAFHDLMHDARVPASSISGGRDFNGWYIYNEHSKDRKREWFWFEKDDYLVAFYAFDDYEIIRRYPVERWLPWKRGAGSVLVERRIAGKSWSE